MSLNRTEQKVYEYVLGHPEEGQHWQDKVRRMVADRRSTGVERAPTAVLADELWEYYLERRRADSGLREGVSHSDLQRISMRNLAEYLLQIWGPIKPGRPER